MSRTVLVNGQRHALVAIREEDLVKGALIRRNGYRAVYRVVVRDGDEVIGRNARRANLLEAFTLEEVLCEFSLAVPLPEEK